MKTPKFPPYPRKPHVGSGQARIKIHGRVIYLGKHGSPGSYARYEEELSAWRKTLEAGRQLPSGPVRTVAQLVSAFLRASQRDPREQTCYRYAVRPLLDLHGKTLVRDFRRKHLREVQEKMARKWKPRVVNRNIVRVRTIWRWGEGEDYVPEGRWDHLRSLPGLRAGNDDVLPVPEADLAAVLPQLGRVVRAAAEVQLLTGARPSEILGLRPCDLVRSGRIELARGHWLELTGGVWVAHLKAHKTAHIGQQRFLLFGPKAQTILLPFLDRPPEAFLFSPKEATDDWFRDNGRTVDFPKRSRRPGVRYRTDAYGKAIRAACRRAGVPIWSPYKLRHNAATRLAEQFGPEVARLVLGHRGIDTTRSYILDGLAAAAKAMKEVG